MKILEAVTDPVYVKSEHSAIDRFFIRLIRDERDLPFIHLTLKITLSMIPAGILLYMPFVGGWMWGVLAVFYLYLNNLRFKGPFGLMLHCTCHRSLFKKEYDYLNLYIPWILAPFFGHSPETYYAHHIGMHHAENNLEEDESTTMPYQRDSLKGFAHYLGTFLAVGVANLARYFFRKKRNRLMYRTIRGELLFMIAVACLCFVNFSATLVVFIIPFIIFRVITIMGNWAQHSFVCAEDPGNSYRNSITCINTKYNHKCWNDGYHISHHIKPSMHWTEHPKFFSSTIDEYASNDAIVFDGIHFLHVFMYLMRKRYDLLAKHFVNLGNRYASDEEVIQFLKSRTAKISFEVPVAEKVTMA